MNNNYPTILSHYEGFTIEHRQPVFPSLVNDMKGDGCWSCNIWPTCVVTGIFVRSEYYLNTAGEAG